MANIDNPFQAPVNVTPKQLNDSSFSKFITKARSTDFARTSKYKVVVSFPQKALSTPPASGFNSGISDMISLYCDNVNMPGMEYVQETYRIYGPSFNRPMVVNFGAGCTLNFLVDKNYQVKAMFEAWMNSVIDPATYIATYSEDYLSSGIIISALSHSDPQYQSSSNDIITHSVRLIDAWPVSMNTLPFDASNPGIQRLAVTFSYGKWTSAYGTATPPTDTSKVTEDQTAGP
jgi:hypothetical protein